VLVNNAGIYRFDAIESVSEQEFHDHFNTNVLGVLLATREALRHFAPNGGSIINIGSVASRLAPPDDAVYVATKSAVDGITRALAKELGGRNIRVNSVNPGSWRPKERMPGGSSAAISSGRRCSTLRLAGSGSHPTLRRSWRSLHRTMHVG
jgi:NAD(P)-dependent dehydrogenase (short-subunit alcohol dehydrogenase family)